MHGADTQWKKNQRPGRSTALERYGGPANKNFGVLCHRSLKERICQAQVSPSSLRAWKVSMAQFKETFISYIWKVDCAKIQRSRFDCKHDWITKETESTVPEIWNQSGMLRLQIQAWEPRAHYLLKSCRWHECIPSLYREEKPPLPWGHLMVLI